MSKPITPLCGCDSFITDSARRVLLIRRSDNGFWALPGGCQNLGETPAACAVRECKEETGYVVTIDRLLGVWSSLSYEYVHYPWKDNEFIHILFQAHIIDGNACTSDESLDVSWFAEDELPPLSDGHASRIEFGFSALKGDIVDPYFE
jgi:ADP-ribose pyrophosphatase YjhB (NUDIX family)